MRARLCATCWRLRPRAGGLCPQLRELRCLNHKGLLAVRAPGSSLCPSLAPVKGHCRCVFQLMGRLSLTAPAALCRVRPDLGEPEVSVWEGVKAAKLRSCGLYAFHHPHLAAGGLGTVRMGPVSALLCAWTDSWGAFSPVPRTSSSQEWCKVLISALLNLPRLAAT